ncbi:hypothetical protein P8C59_005802 [Phyllachora maydis]|uniref:Uncharacterized protein n=1 Tax=Phyllachora maydis TaxID=1825666 RepID=A0AAD9MEV7_9PEZI|nr:hypothetical protein P8C59_005802 [Phyllachora maydis]
MQHFKLVLALVWTMGLGTALGRPARDHGRCASTTFAPGSPGFDLDLCGLAKWESFLPYAEYPMKAGYSYFFSAAMPWQISTSTSDSLVIKMTSNVDVEHKGAAATSASHDRGLDVVVHYWDGLVDTFELGRAGPHALMLHEYADVRDFYGAYHRARPGGRVWRELEGHFDPLDGTDGDADDTARLWRRMLAIQRAFGCYRSARMSAALEAGEDGVVPTRTCLDLLNDSIAELPAADRRALDAFLGRGARCAPRRRSGSPAAWAAALKRRLRHGASAA